MKVFVTGATGLLGSFICKELLKNGHQIRAVKRTNSKMDLLEGIADQIEWIIGDMNDTSFLEDALTGMDAVAHGAAIISFDKRYRERMYETNVLGTADLVNTCLKLGVLNFLHISSVAAIGRKAGQSKITENDRWEGTKFDSIYADSKHSQEMEVWRGAQEGLRVKIVNPSVILGPGLWSRRGSTSVFHYAYSESKFHPAGNVNYVDVRDVAEIGVKLLESDIHGERFIVSSGSVPYKQFFDTLAKAFNKKGPNITVKSWLLGAAVALEFIRSRITGNEALITKDTAIQSRTKFHFDNEKIKKALNFEFRSLEESANWTAKDLTRRYNL